MKKAWEIKRKNSENLFPLCLKMAWKEEKEMCDINWKGSEYQIQKTKKMIEKTEEESEKYYKKWIEAEKDFAEETWSDEKEQKLLDRIEKHRYMRKQMFQNILKTGKTSLIQRFTEKLSAEYFYDFIRHAGKDLGIARKCNFYWKQDRESLDKIIKMISDLIIAGRY